MAVTVLIEGDESPHLAAVADEMMRANDVEDIAVILRIGGVDVASRCAALARREEIVLW
jgi:hypothetical protein